MSKRNQPDDVSHHTPSYDDLITQATVLRELLDRTETEIRQYKREKKVYLRDDDAV